MDDFEKHITKYWTDFPKTWSFLWSPEEAEQIPTEHKDQIHFLDNNGTKFINDYVNGSNMTRYLGETPFKDYFKSIDKFNITDDCDDIIKKWLYNKGIPFSKYVFVTSERSGQAVMLTWKMVIKYWEGLFFDADLIIFDSSLNFGLYFYHENGLYFGTNLIFDKDAEVQKTIVLNQILKNFR